MRDNSLVATATTRHLAVEVVINIIDHAVDIASSPAQVLDLATISKFSLDRAVSRLKPHAKRSWLEFEKYTADNSVRVEFGVVRARRVPIVHINAFTPWDDAKARRSKVGRGYEVCEEIALVGRPYGWLARLKEKLDLMGHHRRL